LDVTQEWEFEACPHCGADAVVIYDRRRDPADTIRAEALVAVSCENPECQARRERELLRN
jgi:hypothetical protein